MRIKDRNGSEAGIQADITPMIRWLTGPAGGGLLHPATPKHRRPIERLRAIADGA